MPPTPAPWLERSGGSVRRVVLFLLLLAPLAASVALAWQSWRLASQYRVAVEQALKIQIGSVEAAFSQRVEAMLWMLADATLQGPQNDQSLEGEAILDTLDDALRDLPACRCGPVVDAEALFWANLDTGARGSRILGSAIDPSFADALFTHLVHRFETAPAWSQSFLFALLPGDSPPHLFLFNWRKQGNGRPLVYGIVANSESLGTEVFQVAKEFVTLQLQAQTAETDRTPSLSFRIRTRGGRRLWQPEPQYPNRYSVERTFLGASGFLVSTVALDPTATSSLIPGGLPRSPLPLLVTIVFGSALFAALGLVLLRRAERLQRAQQEFTARITHELRTPLTQILLYGESLHLNRVASAERRQHGLLVIVREARHLIHLIDNALTFAGAGRSAVGLSRQSQALCPLIEEVIEAMTPQLKAQGSCLKSSLDHRVRAEVDSTAIRQLVRNLLDNALRHGKAGQTLRVELVDRDGSAEITIDDGGPGIPAAERARAFRPFVRLSGRTTGSGLGLAIVKHLVDLHGGTVTLEDAPGGGCRVRIRLPLAEGATGPLALVREEASL